MVAIVPVERAEAKWKERRPSGPPEYPPECPSIENSTKTHIVFKIEVTSGRDINPYSLYPQEAEILLLPSHEFTVSSKPRVEHGYTIIDLVQKSDQEALVS